MEEFYNPEKCIQPFADWLHYWFCNEKSTPMAQVIMAVVFGILLAPFSSGLFALVTFTIIYEIMYYVFTHGNYKYYDTLTRTACINGSFLGFIVGRTLSKDQILYEGVPDVSVKSLESIINLPTFSAVFSNLY